MDEKLASDVLKEICSESRRKNKIIALLIIVIFLSNIAWLIAWNLPCEKTTTETYEMNGEDYANVFYNDEGEVKINE